MHSEGSAVLDDGRDLTCENVTAITMEVQHGRVEDDIEDSDRCGVAS